MAARHKSKKRPQKRVNAIRPALVKPKGAKLDPTLPVAPGQPSAAVEGIPAPREDEPAVTMVIRERSSYDGDTAIKLYLREIGQVKLLTPQEEIELAARIKKGDKKAREQMIKANLRLVVKIARDYEGIGLPL